MSILSNAATVTIANGATVSNAIDLAEMVVVAIQTPSALTSTTFTLQGSSDNSTFAAITNFDGTDYTITVAASKYIVLALYELVGVRYLKVVAGSAEAAERNIILMVRSMK